MKVKSNTNNLIKPSFKSVYNNPLLLKTLKFASEKSALFSGTVALGLSVAARPLAIMATPNTDKENKKHACAKALSSSIVGYLIMLVASTPVSDAVKKIDENPSKFLKSNTIQNLQKGTKSLTKSSKYMFATQLFKLGLSLLIAIPKSVLTCALIPPVMTLFFGKNNNKYSQKNSINNIENENKSPKQSKVISFKGIYNNLTDTLAKGIGHVIDRKAFIGFVEKFKDTNFAQHIMSMTDTILTLSFIHQTKKSKHIKEHRKKPLIHNAAISTGLCITGGYALNALLEKPTEKFINKFKKVNRNLPELEKYLDGIKIAKPAMILGGIYYIIIPLISTFVADRTGKNSVIIKHLD